MTPAGTLARDGVMRSSPSSSQCADCSDASGYSSVILAGIAALLVVVGCCVASNFQAEAEDEAANAAD